ncbi:MAG: leucine-rich repeat domain-containing protein, partial [Firmicutes bacterium]|nr:leucine-rich repeat domain-containing protein [Bacillota bacterium]
ALCVGVIFAATLSMSAEDATVTDSGTCGDNLTWTLTSDGTLTITGTGEMEDYYFGAPWISYGNSITSVVIESGTTSIGEYAFYYYGHLTSVTIPDSVTTIGYSAFRHCTRLTNITIPDSVTSIGEYAFTNTAYDKDEGNWDDGVLYIDNWLIEADGEVVLGEYTIKSGTVGIADYAFSDCKSLTSVTIPDSVTTIGKCAFSNCTSLTSITIPDSVTTIGGRAFLGCTNLTSVTIGDGVTTIVASLFSNFTNLTNVTLGKNVSEIGDDAFYKCTNLTELYFRGDAPEFGDGVFYAVHATAYYPENGNWSESDFTDHGGSITWVGYDSTIFDTNAEETQVPTDDVSNNADDNDVSVDNTNSSVSSENNSDNSSNDNDDTTSSGCGSSLTAVSVIFAFVACCVCVRRKEQ